MKTTPNEKIRRHGLDQVKPGCEENEDKYEVLKKGNAVTTVLGILKSDRI